MPNSRIYNHVHNSLIGSACRGCADMQRIMHAPSASEEVQARAARIFNDMRELSALLRRERVNQDGTIGEIKK